MHERGDVGIRNELTLIGDDDGSGDLAPDHGSRHSTGQHHALGAVP
jgi:hypothetical protein